MTESDSTSLPKKGAGRFARVVALGVVPGADGFAIVTVDFRPNCMRYQRRPDAQKDCDAINEVFSSRIKGLVEALERIMGNHQLSCSIGKHCPRCTAKRALEEFRDGK